MRDRRQHLEGVAVVCSRERSVWVFGVVFLSCVSVSVSGVLFSVGVCVCVCDLLIYSRERKIGRVNPPSNNNRPG